MKTCDGNCFSCIYPDCIVSGKTALALERERLGIGKTNDVFKKEEDYKKRYRKNNSEEINRKAREKRKQNHEEFIEKQREYRRKNAERLAEYRKDYYEKNKEKMLIQQKEYRERMKQDGK